MFPNNFLALLRVYFSILKRLVFTERSRELSHRHIVGIWNDPLTVDRCLDLSRPASSKVWRHNLLLLILLTPGKVQPDKLVPVHRGHLQRHSLEHLLTIRLQNPGNVLTSEPRNRVSASVLEDGRDRSVSAVVNDSSNRMKCRATSHPVLWGRRGRSKTDALRVKHAADRLKQVPVLVNGVRSDERSRFPTRRLPADVTVVVESVNVVVAVVLTHVRHGGHHVRFAVV